MDSVLAFTNGRLDPLLKFLPPSSLIDVAMTGSLYLKSVQLFLTNIKKNCSKINIDTITQKMMDNCLFEVNRQAYIYVPNKNIMKIIKCVNGRYYGWVIAGKHMALTGGKRRPYPDWFSRSNGGENHYYSCPILRVIPYKAFQE